MIILDTDHLTVLRYEDDSRYAALTSRLDAALDQHIVTTAVTVEEQMRGWLAEINRWRQIRRQIPAYERLARMVEFLSEWEIIRLDAASADEFDRLRKQGIRIGTQDLKNRLGRADTRCPSSFCKSARFPPCSRTSGGELPRMTLGSTCDAQTTAARHADSALAEAGSPAPPSTPAVLI